MGSTPTIDDAFITAFNSDMHLVYQQKPSKFRGLVRTDGEVVGETLRFQKLGTLTMATKSRLGEVPLSNPEHTHADATMTPKYCRVGIDKLDLSLLNIDVRRGYAENMAMAANREVDDGIIAAMDAGGTTHTVTAASGLTRNIALEICKTLDEQEVPDDGMRFAALTPAAWSFLYTISEFANADYVGPEFPFKSQGVEVRTWLGIHWFRSTRMTGQGTANAKCYIWHKSAVGHGIANDIEATWGWNTAGYRWDGVTALQMGSVVIDDNGIIQLDHADNASLP